MEHLHLLLPPAFILITLFTIFLFYKAANNSKLFLAIVLAWLLLQGILSLRGFYTFTASMPPRFILLLWPPVLFIIVMFITKRGRAYIDRLNLKTLTLLHIVRAPVELVLYWLFLYEVIPGIATFEGRNLDILSGLTAPVLLYFGFKNKIGKKILLIWNFVCLGLLVNIVVISILAAPFPFQKFSFSQPNIAMLYFPFTWLPGCIVPLVLLSHLAAIRQLLKKDRVEIQSKEPRT